MTRLLWIRKMADAGIALEDIRDAFADTAPAGADRDQDVAGILERLEGTLIAQEEELRRQRAAVQRMRTQGSRMGLLSDFVTSRLERLPEGSLRQADLDNLLVMERIFGPLGAAVKATRFIALATHPGLREASDRVDTAEEALDDTVAVDDPRVAQVAAERHAFEQALQAAIEESGLARRTKRSSTAGMLCASLPLDEGEGRAGRGSGGGQESMSAVEAMEMHVRFPSSAPPGSWPRTSRRPGCVA